MGWVICPECGGAGVAVNGNDVKKCERCNGGEIVREADFQRQVLDLAHYLGWRSNHVRKSTVRQGKWATSTSCVGWPDLTLWHPRRGIIFVELKAEKGRVSPAQHEVLESLAAAGGRTFTWQPKDWPEIEAVLKGES